MKKFDLDKALKGYPVVTRSGEKVEQIFYFDKAIYDCHNLVFVVKGIIRSVCPNGRIGGQDDDWDLFMDYKPKKLWIGVKNNKFRCESKSYGVTPAFKSKEELKSYLIDFHDEEIEKYYQLIEIELEEIV